MFTDNQEKIQINKMIYNMYYLNKNSVDLMFGWF